MLTRNGGHVTLTRGWTFFPFEANAASNRKPQLRLKLSNGQLEQRRRKCLLNISGMVRVKRIPDELILNCDQRGLNLVPPRKWTLEKVSASKVDAGGMDLCYLH